MPFAPHFRVTANGRLGPVGGEQFSYGFALGNTGVQNFQWSSYLTNLWSDIKDDVVAFHGRANTKISVSAVLEMVKIAIIGADGKYLDDPKIYVVNQAGGGILNHMSIPQGALAMSLNTDRRGPTGRGRFYIPMPVVDTPAAAHFQIEPSNITALVGSLETLVQDVNNHPGMDADSLSVVVASSKGYNSPVTSVRVGRIVDTMRSRRNRLDEAYSADVSIE